jgi:hypothetical protein
MAWEGIITAGAVVGAIGVILMFMFKGYKIIKRIDDALGVDEQGRTVSQRLTAVEGQLTMPDGRSITEKINAIEREQVSLQAQFGTLQRLLGTLLRRNGDLDGSVGD